MKNSFVIHGKCFDIAGICYFLGLSERGFNDLKDFENES
jgi:hypothetical protein